MKKALFITTATSYSYVSPIDSNSAFLTGGVQLNDGAELFVHP